jgi:hypothetical protein
LILTSDHIIKTLDGEKIIGKMLSLPREKGMAYLKTDTEKRIILLDSISEISVIDKDFIHRFTFAVNAGFTFTKANNIYQRSVATSVVYDSDKLDISADFSTEGTTQDEVDPIRRTEGNMSVVRDAFGKVKVLGGVNLLNNSEQLLDLRTTLRVGLGAYFIQKEKVDFLAGAGLTFVDEKYGGATPEEGNNFEGFGVVRLNLDEVKGFSLQARMIVYPSIFSKSRFRVDSDIALKYDLPFNLFVEMSYAHDLDNSPLVESPDFDFVLKTTLGWSWN